MHSRDPNKDAGKFREEIEAILEGASGRREDRFDFTGFVFPDADFIGATFTRYANFSGATFTHDADFRDAKFTQDANFSGAKFTQNADFLGAKFTQDADFMLAKFTQNANFSGATFTQDADFSDAKFTQDANFSGATFTQNANFSGAKFTQDADFLGAKFTQDANFSGATFTQNADFLGAKFTQDANFMLAKFTQNANFLGAKFTQDADFQRASFTQGANFSGATFGGITDFQHAEFEHPAQVLFRRINEGTTPGMRARFVDCLLEGVRFEDVHWYREKGRKGRIMLQDELDLGGELYATHELVADAYRRLVNNFEKARAYEPAEDCVIGEMEMRRLNPRNLPLARWARLEEFYDEHPWPRWVGSHLSVTYLYRVLSVYGSSYRRAFAWLAGLVFLVFPLLFAAFGLRMGESSSAQPAQVQVAASSPAHAPISWSNAWREKARAHELWQTYKAGVWTSVEVATFQRRLTVEPANRQGQRTADVEMVVVPGQAALFLLALRRRFRR